MSENVTIDMSKFSAGMARLKAVGKSAKIYDALEAGAVVIQAHAQNNAREKLNKHPTGNLIGNFGIKRRGKTVLVGVWGVVYAAIHEFGGVIKPIHSKKLAIPMPGVTGSPRQYDLHLQGFGGMVMTLADKFGHVMFVLKDSVHIPARPYLRPAVDENKAAIEKAIGDNLAAIIAREVK